MNINWKTLDLPTRLKLIGVGILLVGLLSAALIYVLAAQAPDESNILDMPQNTKIYRHDLELYGGKLNVMLDDFNRWLWQGKTLAKIIACLSIIIALALFYVANHLEPVSEPESYQENERQEPD